MAAFGLLHIATILLLLDMNIKRRISAKPRIKDSVKVKVQRFAERDQRQA